MTPASKSSTQAPRRVQAVVALRLLEVIRDQDHPGEVLESEDPTVTMPRRLGLSDVVERQIRTYREDVKKGVRLTEEEVRDLFRLVIRRPDSEDVFLTAGRVLAEETRSKVGFSSLMPRRVAFALARMRMRRGLSRLFGRRIGGFGRGAFVVEGRALPFYEADPGGEACFLMSGYGEAILSRTAGKPARVFHTLCQANGDDLCRWEGEFVDDDLAPPVGAD